MVVFQDSIKKLAFYFVVFNVYEYLLLSVWDRLVHNFIMKIDIHITSYEVALLVRNWEIAFNRFSVLMWKLVIVVYIYYFVMWLWLEKGWIPP